MKNEVKLNLELLNDIKTPEIAYLLGFIWADGYIEKTSNRIDISIAEDDSEQIINFCNLISNWGIHKVKKQKESWKQAVSISKCNKKLHDYFLENDYLLKSTISPNKILSKIPKKLQHYWWRGYFDGDGCINITNNKKRASICSSYEQDWQSFDNLSKELNIKFRLEKTKRLNKQSLKENKYSKIHIENFHSLMGFFNYIYNNYELDRIGLVRKYEKWKIIENYINNLKPKTSKYKYICFNNRNKKWKCDYKKKHLGWFKSEKEAYDFQQEYIKNL